MNYHFCGLSLAIGIFMTFRRLMGRLFNIGRITKNVQILIMKQIYKRTGLVGICLIHCKMSYWF